MNKFYLLFAVLLAVPFATAAYQYNYTANSTYVVSANASYIFVEVWGAGGSGASALSGNNGGGGAGGTYSSSLIAAVPGRNYTVIVGAGGAGKTSGTTNGDAGQASNFTFNGSNVVLATGGGGGTSGAGGTSSISSNVYNYKAYAGGAGSFGTPVNVNTAGGGGGAGNGGAGNVSGSGGAGGSGNGEVTNSQAGGSGGNSITVSSGASADPGSAPSGGGGARACTASCGVGTSGAGARGEVRITELFSPSIIRVYDSVNNSLVYVPVNLTLNNRDTFVSYSMVSSDGNFINESILDGVYEVVIDAAGYNTNYALLTVNSGADATFYVDSSTVSRLFNVRDGFAQAVENATITFSRTINSTLVAYTQVVTDSSGFITVNLNPSFLYLITGTEPTGTYLNYSGSVLPNQDITYVIQFSFSPINPYFTPSNNTYTVIEANYYNATKIINVTWEVISPVGDLEYFGLYTTYNNTNYSQNITGIPGGGIAYVNITGVDLSVQDTIYVTHYFKRTGYSELSTVTTFNFLDYTPSNSSIIGGMFDGTNAPSSLPGRVLLGTIITIMIITATYSVTKNESISGFVGVCIIGIFSVPSVGLFPLLYGIIAISVGSMAILARFIN